MSALKRIAVISGGGHSRMIIDLLLRLQDFSVQGYTDLNDRGSIFGVPYLGEDSIIISSGIPYAALGLVYLESPLDMAVRKKIIAHFSTSPVIFPPVVSGSAIVSPFSTIGHGTVIGNGAVINPGCRIGEFSIINTGAIIDHDTEIGNNSVISPGAVVNGGIRIAGEVFVGAGAILRDGISVCTGAVIGAGANVVRSVVEPGLYMGNPAKRVLKSV